MKPNLLQYIDFFEQFARAHVDIAAFSAVDNPMRASKSTAQSEDRSERFISSHMARVSEALSNNTDAQYKAMMYLETFDFAPYQAQASPPNQMMYNGAVTITKIGNEGETEAENELKELTQGIVLDLVQYINVASYYTENCHPFLQNASLQQMKVIPEFNLLAPNDHGWTLEFTFLQFQPSSLRLGKFRSSFLSALPATFTEQSPLNINPASTAAGQSLAISSPTEPLQSTNEVRLCLTSSPQTCYRLPEGNGASTFEYLAPNLVAQLPALMDIGTYTVEIYTAQGSWLSGQLLTITL